MLDMRPRNVWWILSEVHFSRPVAAINPQSTRRLLHNVARQRLNEPPAGRASGPSTRIWPPAARATRPGTSAAPGSPRVTVRPDAHPRQPHPAPAHPAPAAAGAPRRGVDPRDRARPEDACATGSPGSRVPATRPSGVGYGAEDRHDKRDPPDEPARDLPTGSRNRPDSAGLRWI